MAISLFIGNTSYYGKMWTLPVSKMQNKEPYKPYFDISVVCANLYVSSLALNVGYIVLRLCCTSVVCGIAA